MNSIDYTKYIFERLCKQIPPLVPDDIQKDMSHALEQVQDNVSLTLEELEHTAIAFAKKLWPYREAFLEFYRVNEGAMGETFLLKKFTPRMKKVYEEFKESGGTFRDLHCGGPSTLLFTSEERAKLCEALVEVQHELWDFTYQQMLSTHVTQYKERVQEFKQIFVRIEEELEHLRDMAEKEQEHPSLATEIRAQIRGFEERLALLGPKFDFEELCNVKDYVHERKSYKVLNRHTH